MYWLNIVNYFIENLHNERQNIEIMTKKNVCINNTHYEKNIPKKIN